MNLKGRVQRLENMDPEARRWHRIIREVGQSHSDALSAYEAGNGQVDHSKERLIYVSIVKPQLRT
ncbi:MAG: hypothetical protein R3E21_08395 [Caenibius sp.]